MSSSASHSSATDVPANAKRWNKRSSDGEKTVIAQPRDGSPPRDDGHVVYHADAGADIEDHAGAPTPSDFLRPDLPDRVSDKVLTALTSREEADIIKKHGLYMLLLCADANDDVLKRLEENKMYALVDGIDAKGGDNR